MHLERKTQTFHFYRGKFKIFYLKPIFLSFGAKIQFFELIF